MVAHPVLVRGAHRDRSRRGPLIVARTDEEFLPVLLEELERENGLAAVIDRAAEDEIRVDPNVLKLYPPVQRVHHLALFEVVCDLMAPVIQPRLDPERIESAGLVLRRLATREQVSIREGWRQAGRKLRGWIPFSAAEEDLDPDPSRRPRLTTGNSDLDRRLNALPGAAETLSESVSPLFVAPPSVCEAAGKTLLYGVIPLASSEQSEVDAPVPPHRASDIADHLPIYLREGPERSIVPRANATLSFANVQALGRGGADPAPQLADFLVALRRIAVEFNAFGQGPENRALLEELNRIALPMASGATLGAGEFFRRATDALLDDGASFPTVTMPDRWPAIDTAQAARLLACVSASVAAGLKTISAREGRFDAPDRRYTIRGFVRVLREDGCPPETIWSDYSEPFTIAPWYESRKATPPARVPLPDLFDRALLKQLKPNVAFVVPSSLFNFMNGNSPKKMLDGEAGKGGGVTLEWICSFSIPVITFCAFIVLNLFLQLFDLVFQWMLYIKICLPLPKRSS